MIYNKYRDIIFIMLMFTFILEYELIIVNKSYIDKIIKLVPLILLIIFFTKIRGNNKNVYIKKVIRIYFVLLLFMCISVLLNLSIESMYAYFKFVTIFLILPFILYNLNPHYFSDRIIRFPIAVGIFFSIHSIVLWLLVYFGFRIDYSFLTNELTGSYLAYNSFWGNMMWAKDGGWDGITRTVGFFLSPDRLGRFLIFPVFVSFGYYILNRKFIYLIASLLCFLALILTLSYGTIFSSLGVIVIAIVSKKVYKLKIFKKSIVMPFVIGGLISLALIFGVHKYAKSAYITADNLSTKKIYRVGEYEEVYHFLTHKNYVKPDISKPFGKSFIVYNYEGNIFMSQYALERWINIGGVPIVIIFFIYFYHMFKVHVFPALVNKSSGIVYYVALAYFAQTLMHFQHGNWWEPFYFYITAILILLKTYEYRKKPKQAFYSNLKLS